MKKLIILFALIALLAAGCAPATSSPTPFVPTDTPVPPRPTRTPTLIPSPTETPTITPTSTPAAEMYAPVMFVAKIVCRMGPDENYNPVMTYQAGETAELNGRNDDSTWLMVAVTEKNKDAYCWVPSDSAEKPGDLGGLNVVPSGKLPEAPSSLTATSGVCGSTSNPMILEWSPVAAGTGYRIYRNYKLIGSVYDGRFRDFDTPKSKEPYVYTYGVQAFNAYGVSEHMAGVSVTLCNK